MQFISGMGAGMFEVGLASYISEITETKYRARAFIALVITYFAGSVVSLLMGFALVPGLSEG